MSQHWRTSRVASGEQLPLGSPSRADTPRELSSSEDLEFGALLFALVAFSLPVMLVMLMLSIWFAFFDF